MDFEDLIQPANLITLAATPDGRILYLSRPNATVAYASSARALQHLPNDNGMKKQTDPRDESLEEMLEIDDQRFRRRPGRGHHVERDAGQIVAIDADLLAHFGSAEAVNGALRQIVASKKAAGS